MITRVGSSLNGGWYQIMCYDTKKPVYYRKGSIHHIEDLQYKIITQMPGNYPVQNENSSIQQGLTHSIHTKQVKKSTKRSLENTHSTPRKSPRKQKQPYRSIYTRVSNFEISLA